MAKQKVWLGNLGPFIYDDTEDLPGEPPGTKPYGVRTSGRLRAADALNDDEIPTRGQVELKDSSLLRASDIIDALNSVATDKPLSANQGRILKQLIDAVDVSSYVQKSGDTMTGELLFNGANTIGTSVASAFGIKTNNVERVRVEADGSRITLPLAFLQGTQRSYTSRISDPTGNAISINITEIQNSRRGIVKVNVYYKVRSGNSSRYCAIEKIFLCQRAGASTSGNEIVVRDINGLTTAEGIFEVTWEDKDTSSAYIKIHKPAGTSNVEAGGLIEITSHVNI